VRNPVPTAVPAAPPADVQAYAEGLSAFREATPEGYGRAASLFSQASRLVPASCDYALHQAEALYMLGQKLKLNWEDFAPTVAEADTLLESSDKQPACNVFESYITRLRVLRGVFSGVRTIENIALLDHAIAADPDDPMNWVVLTQLRSGRRSGQSFAPSERAAELAPQLPVATFELGNYYLSPAMFTPVSGGNNDAFSKARNAYEQTLQHSPRHFEAMLGIAYSLSVEGDAAAGRIEPLLQKAVEIAPRSLKARMALGDYYAGFEETEMALEQYRATASLNANFYPAFLSAGTALVTADRPDEAVQAFEAVIALEPNKPHPPFNAIDMSANAQAHYFLGNIRLAHQELVTARADFEAALSDIPNYALALYGRAIVSFEEGKLEEALADLDAVIQQGPRQYPNAYLVRGGIRADRRQFAESMTDLNLALDIYRQQAAALESKAKLDEVNGFQRRAEGQRRRKASIESTIEKALEVKKRVEALMPGDLDTAGSGRAARPAAIPAPRSSLGGASPHRPRGEERFPV
jgi:tetratricopeptide (TPR) repeat protein